MKYYFKNIKKFKFKIALYFILVIVTWGISLAQPYLSALFIDSLVERKEFSFIKLIILVIILINLLYIFLSYILGITETKLSNHISYMYISDIIYHFQHLPLGKINTYDPVYITQRIKGDVLTIVKFFLKEIINIFMNILCIFISLIFLLSISNTFIYLLSFFLPVYFLLYFIIKKPLYEKGYRAKDTTDQFVEILTQQILSIKPIKIYSSFNQSISQIEEQFKRMFENVLSYTKISYVFSSLDHVITITFQAMVFIIFAKQVYLNEISIGQFTMINTYFGFIISSIKYFMSLGKSFQDMEVSKKRLEEILLCSREHNGNKTLNSIEEVTVENVTFSYEFDQKDKMLILDNLNLFLKTNYIYLIKGKNGSGKSTLFDIMIGMYQEELESGTIKFNNNKMELIDMYELRRNNIGFVSQTIYHGRETVLEFLTFNCCDKEILSKDFTDEIIMENQKLSTKLLGNKIIFKIKEYKIEDFFINAHFNIMDLFDRKMHELSGGQCQKVLILREILKNPDLLFFDEPTSSLDQKSILELKEVIQNIKKNKIILITTHEDYFDDIADEEIYLI